MRVAMSIVLCSIFFVAAGVGAAPLVDAPVSYPTAVAKPAAAPSQDAIRLAAVQQERDPASSFKSASLSMAAQARMDEMQFDRRLASLDPSQIVYEQSQSQPPLAQAGLLDMSNGRLFSRQEQSERATRPHARSSEDFLLMGFAALMLVAYQLRKKHRFLRPHPFSY